MSLVTILRSDKEIGNKFTKELNRPYFKKPVLEEELYKPDHPVLYGIATDYLLRMFIERINKDKTIDKIYWIAEEHTRNLLKDSRRIKRGANKNEYILTSVEQGERTVKKMQKVVNETKKNYKQYLQKGIFTTTLIKNVHNLAEIDIDYRTPAFTLIDFIKPSKNDINHLKEMCEQFDENLFKAKRSCHLNPKFGVGSYLCGGADADIIIDDTLIDIKTTKKYGFEKAWFTQLLGYTFLAKLGGVNGNLRKRKIKNIGIYFARQKFLWTIPLSKLGNEAKLERSFKWFVNHLVREYAPHKIEKLNKKDKATVMKFLTKNTVKIAAYNARTRIFFSF
ncbi:MAG: hypothetical protein HYV28_06525 [Ignavibacteriales bacterium]|nr:hypothetical protein [Ignavibacteriales bacterium]